ncbi:hypothetical protein BBK36DRAFT_1139053 [Trichoderma citrinoviride]|uniref:Uncharacterized protein n=1 Tax=Trichoderma citrinoviride TaxID=58853 RepID=A0A2T4BI24_9HYPO|nr:hypothetical protein BBK36DRAFT_1139053 [Trichoderma citrinoviride]PTB68963.1 hypothetical protein BBK36DRAFT_1139053 [Trichoderma citrinoviride]
MPQAMGLVLFPPGQSLLNGSYASKLKRDGSAIVPKKSCFWPSHPCMQRMHQLMLSHGGSMYRHGTQGIAVIPAHGCGTALPAVSVGLRRGIEYGEMPGSLRPGAAAEDAQQVPPSTSRLRSGTKALRNISMPYIWYPGTGQEAVSATSFIYQKHRDTSLRHWPHIDMSVIISGALEIGDKADDWNE